MNGMYGFGNGCEVGIRLPRLPSHGRQTEQTVGYRHDLEVSSRATAFHQTITHTVSRFEVLSKFIARLESLDI
jgi:hypothetical protein